MKTEKEIKLVINIDHQNPIDLSCLSNGLNGLASIYSDLNKHDINARLLVKEVRKSSIEIDLVTLLAGSTIPLLSNVNNIIQFCNYINLIIATCKKQDAEDIKKMISENGLPKITDKPLKDFEKTLGVINEPKDSFNLIARDINNNNVYNNCTFNGIDAKLMRENIPGLVDNETTYIYKKQLFKWVQTNFEKKKTGNKGLIENLHEKPLIVIFEDDIYKEEMMTSTDGVDWNQMFYTVDVEMQVSSEKPRRYKILKNYAEDSFPSDTEDSLFSDNDEIGF